MDDTLLFIPPCCVDKKLPSAIMQSPRRALSFYTHGDVLMEKFYRAVSYLVADPAVMVVAMPVAQPSTIVFLRQCFERGWITDLVLSTCRDVSSLVHKHLDPYTCNMLYQSSTDVSDVSSHMVLYTASQALSIQGPMYAECYNTPPLVGYTMLYHPRFEVGNGDWSNPMRNILLPDVLRHRRAKVDVKQCSGRLYRFLHFQFPPYEQ